MKHKISNTLLTVLILIVLASGVLLGLEITGYETRKYSVLKPENRINGIKIRSLVEKYKPIIYQPQSIRPNPVFIYYEVTTLGDNITITYYIVWPDEYHPNLLIDSLYRMFRILYFGSSTDIEFVKCILNRSSLDIIEVHFETLVKNTLLEIPEHTLLILRNESGRYVKICGEIKETLDFCPFANKHLILQVISWNHLFNITKHLRGRKYDLPPKFLTDEEYKMYKMRRRFPTTIQRKKSLDIIIELASSLLIFALLIRIKLHCHVLPLIKIHPY